MYEYDFVAVDFETACKQYDSACSIGIAAVKGAEIVETYYSLLNPQKDFSSENIAIHGITADDVKDAPTFKEIWPKISRFFGEYAVVAHNAYFDMSVLKKSAPWTWDEPYFKYIDSISICTNFVPGRKDLANCAESLGVTMKNHHNALDDAVVCANIVIKCIQNSGASNLGQLCFSMSNVKIHDFSDLQISKQTGYFGGKAQYTKRAHREQPKISDIKMTIAQADPTGLLYGKTVVFTGELTISRTEAMQIAVNAGAIVRGSVSRKTDFLVVGVQDEEIVGEDGLSSKEERACELNKCGEGHIQFISEQKFIELAGIKELV